MAYVRVPTPHRLLVHYNVPATHRVRGPSVRRSLIVSLHDQTKSALETAFMRSRDRTLRRAVQPTQFIYLRRAHGFVRPNDLSCARKKVFRLSGSERLSGDDALNAAAGGGSKRNHRRSFRVRHLRHGQGIVLAERKV